MKDAIFIILIFGIGIAIIYAFARITEKINAQGPPDYELKTYSYKKIFRGSLVGIFIVTAVSIGIYAFSRSFELAVSLGAFFLCIVLAYLVWGLHWQRWEKRRGARLEE
jgi:Ca2+/Na+ antiporter